MTKPGYKATTSSYVPSPIEFTDEEIARYQKTHFRYYGQHITKQEAAYKYASVVRFIRIALRHHMQKRKEKLYDI